MKVVLFNRHEYVISNAAGEKLKRAIEKSSEGFVTLNGDMVRKSAIALIKAGGNSEADLHPKVDAHHRLGTDTRTDDEKYKAARAASEIARKRVEEIKAKRQEKANPMT